MTLDLNAALAVADQLARRAGVLLREGAQRPRNISYKGVLDLVTDTDKASEAMIVEGLQSAYPDHGIVGEEGSQIKAADASAPYYWHVDPLDGTTNFAHGIPHFSTSIALAGPDGLPVVGVIYDPIRDECFHAVKGQGATLNGKPIHVSPESDLSKSTLSTGFPRDRWTNPDNNIEEMVNFLMRARTVSRLGSAALDLCYVAAGRFGGFWEPRIHSWDVMAGLLCVTEAGGRVSNYHGQREGVYEGDEVVASNGLIHDRMLTVLVLGNAAPRPGKPE
ncbi:MAG: inositol monophosphatase family protein [Chloroflexota bacterium]